MRATIILTYRDGATDDRRRNLEAVTGWLAQWPDQPLIVVEQDTFPRLTEPLQHPNGRIVFAYNPGPFNKAWGLNVGARRADTSLLIFSDADLVAGDMLPAMIAAAERGFEVVKPYRRLIDLTPEETARVRDGKHAFVPERGTDIKPNREGIAERIVLCGGMFLIRAAAFALIGAWDERFRGWGGEDDAMTLKIQRARLATVELDERPAVHLWHPRPHGSTYDHPHYAENHGLVQRYLRYSDAELSRLGELNRQTMGHREKYRPFA